MTENQIESKEGHQIAQPGNKEVQPFNDKASEPEPMQFPNNIETKNITPGDN